MAALVRDPGRTSRLAGRAVLACQSDARLAALAADDHERAFDVLVERYRKPLLRHCARVLPASRAEDAVQQAFLNAHAALTRDGAPTDFKPWLYRVAHNAALNMLRQNGWNYDPIPADVDGVPRPDQIAEQRIELQQTVAAIGALPERQRDALVMRELEGRSYAEIAAFLGAGDGAVRQLLNRARAAVRSAATMLTPPPLVERAASLYPGDGSRAGRAAEIIGGLGAGGAVKAGATALVAGSLVVGVVQPPLPLVGHHTKAAAHHAHASSGGHASAATPAADSAHRVTLPATAHGNAIRNRSSHRHASHAEHRGRAGAHPRGDHHSASEHSGPDVRPRSESRAGSGDQHTTNDGGGDSHSGSSGGSPDVSRDGTSGSGETTSGGDPTSGSGTSGSDGTSGSGESTTTTSGGSTSGSSGETTTTTTTTSGDGTSGSGGTSTEATSGTSGDTTSGSATP